MGDVTIASSPGIGPRRLHHAGGSGDADSPCVRRADTTERRGQLKHKSRLVPGSITRDNAPA